MLDKLKTQLVWHRLISAAEEQAQTVIRTAFSQSVRTWLDDWLSACAGNGGQPPDDLSPWLPWSMDEDRRRQLKATQ